MQTLIFNTTTKTVTVFEGVKSQSPIIYTFSDVPTVKVNEGYYEVMREFENSQDSERKMREPAARFPISATNMLIQK